MEFLRTLNSEIVIDDIVIKKMRYDINMLFINCTSSEKANILARKIHAQIDKVLIGINEIDRENLKKLILTDSFLVVKNPIKKNISYGNVFTELTNFDNEFVRTKERLIDWLDKNTEVEYDEVTLTSYINTYKVKNTEEKLNETIDLQYEPLKTSKQIDKTTENLNDDIPKITKLAFLVKGRFKAAIYLFTVLLIFYIFNITSNNIVSDDIKKDDFVVPELFESHFSGDFEEYLNSYYFYKTTGIPYEFQYKDVSLSLIEEFLTNQDSLLVESDYINIILKNSKEHNINPILLFSIIGQEQGFVPKNNINSARIINNPYNVFGSWIDYNTSFEDSTEICLNTIINSAKKRPKEIDFVKWLNYSYAEDKNWSKGVSSIFTSLQHIILK